MPYDPSQILAPYLQPTATMLPQILAHKLARERLAQQEEQFKVKKPGIEIGAKLGQAQLDEIEQVNRARQEFMNVIQGGIGGFGGQVLPEGLTPEMYMKGIAADMFKPVTPKRKAEPKTQPVWNEAQQRWIHGQPVAGEIAKPKAIPKAPTTRVGLNKKGQYTVHERDISGDWIDTGLVVHLTEAEKAAIKTKEMEKRKKPTYYDLLKQKEKVLVEKAEFEQFRKVGSSLSAGLADMGIVLEPGEEVPETAMQAVGNVWQKMIDEIDRQILFYGYTPAKPAVAPQATAPSVDSYIKRKLKK